ncbi:protein MucA [Flavobacteriaceae bacterium UJ101]|nr:protein MucA [Flavobacteriaceae bacterium UJ101]
MKLINIHNISKDSEIELIPFKTDGMKVYVKYYSDGVQAGFPSPAEDFTELPLSLDEKFLSKPESTYLVRVKSDSMEPTLIEGDILIVRSDLPITHNKIVIASLNSDAFTVKRFLKTKDQNTLSPDNTKYKPVSIAEEDTVLYLGQVVSLVREF